MALAPSILSALQQYRLSLIDAKNRYMQLHPIFVSWLLNGYAIWLNQKVNQKLEEAQEITNYINLHGHPLDPENPSSPFEPDSPIEALEEVSRKEVLCSLIIIDALELPALQNDRLSALFIRDLVDEQTEEEATASELLERSRLFYNGQPPRFGLDLLDDWLSQ
jgi:ferritin